MAPVPTPELNYNTPFDTLPSVELSAARLDGELYCIADAFCPVDLPETPRIRAQAVMHSRSLRLIAERDTAAWIWGATVAEPAVHQFCASSTARSKSSVSSGPGVREVVIHAQEMRVLGGRQVTSPLRTACDIVRSSPTFDTETQDVVLILLAQEGHTVADCSTLLEERKNLPGKKKALHRLALLTSAHSIDIVDRVDSTNSVEHSIQVGRVSHLENELTQH